ncbi:conserved hypothetical protein [Gammaproteobacteria bacterium]
MKTIRTVWLPFLVGIIFLTAGYPTSGENAERFATDRLEQLVAPIALYPDTLLAQILMASTYPLEVVQAARWTRQHPGLTGERLQDALAEEPWDPSVKSLVAFPEVIGRMEEELDWMEDLGNAFLSRQEDIMDVVQRMRARAQAAGYLESTPQQEVVERAGEIIIEPVQSDVVYVPVYNPPQVFVEDWNYPTIYYPGLYAREPPPSLHKPWSYDRGNLLTFGIGVAIGAVLFSQLDWHHHDVIVNHRQDRHHPGEAMGPIQWRHDPWHRHNVSYHDPALEQRYQRVPSQQERPRDDMSNPSAHRPSPSQDRPVHYPSAQNTNQGDGGGFSTHRPTSEDPRRRPPLSTRPSTAFGSTQEDNGEERPHHGRPGTARPPSETSQPRERPSVVPGSMGQDNGNSGSGRPSHESSTILRFPETSRPVERPVTRPVERPVERPPVTRPVERPAERPIERPSVVPSSGGGRPSHPVQETPRPVARPSPTPDTGTSREPPARPAGKPQPASSDPVHPQHRSRGRDETP